MFTMDIEPPLSTFGRPIPISEPGSNGRAASTAKLPRIVRNDAGWRQVLSQRSFQVMRRGRDRTGVQRRVRRLLRDRHLPLCGVRHRRLHIGFEIRLPDGLAQLQRRVRRGQYLRGLGPQLGPAPTGSELRALRFALGPCLQRRPAADPAALLHQLGGLAVHAARRLISARPTARPSMRPLAPVDILGKRSDPCSAADLPRQVTRGSRTSASRCWARPAGRTKQPHPPELLDIPPLGMPSRYDQGRRGKRARHQLCESR